MRKIKKLVMALIVSGSVLSAIAVSAHWCLIAEPVRQEVGVLDAAIAGDNFVYCNAIQVVALLFSVISQSSILWL